MSYSKKDAQDAIVKCQETVKKDIMSAMFFHDTHKFHYGSLKSTLAQDMSIGMNQYPCLLQEAMIILNFYNKPQGDNKKQ